MSFFNSNAYILDRRKIAYTYDVTTPAATTPVTLAEVKVFLKLDPTDTSEDTFLTLLINMAVEIGERYTGRDFINKGYTTYRDNFIEPIELRRSKVSAIASISYLVDAAFVVVSSSIYGLQVSNNFPYVYLKNDSEFPTDGDVLPQAVKILFTSGYGATAASVPAALKLAILQHINGLYTNRGDCSSDCSGDGSNGALAANLRALYNPFRIMTIGSYERPASHPRVYYA